MSDLVVNYIPISEVSRESVGRVYASAQILNMFLSAASEADLTEYGSRIYDVCKSFPGNTAAVRVDTGAVVGAFMCMNYSKVDEFDVTTPGLNQVCVDHWDFCKYVTALVVDPAEKNKLTIPEKVTYAVWGGVLPSFEGLGVYNKLETLVRQAAGDANITHMVAYTTNNTMLSKSMAQRKIKNRRLILSVIDTLPSSMLQRFLPVGNNKEVLRIFDAREYRTKDGRHPYKSQTVWSMCRPIAAAFVGSGKIEEVAKL